MQNHIQTNHSLFRLHCATLLLKGLVLGLRLVLSGTMILSLPQDLQIHALTYLRAADLGHVQISCRIFNEPNLIQAIIDKFANEVYPTELTEGFDTAVVGGERNATSCPGNSFWTSYEALRNMEMVVVARILSRPEPPVSERLKGGFYVSKSWCKTTLKWLDFQSEERRRKEKELADAKRSETIALSHNKKGKYNPAAKQKILLKKQHRKQRKADIVPPSPNVNEDITCEHGRLMRCDTSRVRSKLRLVDKQCWRVLKKLYPEGVQLNSMEGECLQCVLEAQTEKRNLEALKQKETENRKKPLSCPLVRGFYTRRNGVPKDSLVAFASNASERDPFTSPVARRTSNASLFGRADCPLLPGVYSCLPRSWCHGWRKYIKSGGEMPPAPDSSSILCDAHRLPLLPPHLESFLNGETENLLDVANISSNNLSNSNQNTPTITHASIPVGHSPVEFRLGGRYNLERQQLSQNDIMDLSVLRASGIPESEIQLQRIAMLQIEETRARERRHEEILQRQNQIHFGRDERILSPEEVRANINAHLDRENRVVVEILTDEEITALEHWWPGVHCYILKFAVVQSEHAVVSNSSSDIIWTTQPCRLCDPSSRTSDCSIGLYPRNRSRKK